MNASWKVPGIYWWPIADRPGIIFLSSTDFWSQRLHPSDVENLEPQEDYVYIERAAFLGGPYCGSRCHSIKVVVPFPDVQLRKAKDSGWLDCPCCARHSSAISYLVDATSLRALILWDSVDFRHHTDSWAIRHSSLRRFTFLPRNGPIGFETGPQNLDNLIDNFICRREEIVKLKSRSLPYPLAACS